VWCCHGPLVTGMTSCIAGSAERYGSKQIRIMWKRRINRPLAILADCKCRNSRSQQDCLVMVL
jgi:hypothetical protein